MNQPFDEITETLRDYFDGIYESSEEKMRRAFHPNAHVYSVVDGAIGDSDLDHFVGRVTGHASAASQNATRTDRIVSVDFSGPNEAMAKVELSIPGIDFVDFLSLMKVDGRWRIIAKTYHAMPRG